MSRLTQLMVAAAALAGTTAALAAAAGAPTATTVAAGNVAATTATLNGKVGPNGIDTNYYFQYGTTTAYGGQTPTQGPVKGTKEKPVAADVTGLSPSTTYHYRLVATSSAGTTDGADMTFTTAAPGTFTGTAVTIAASRRTVTFGGATTIAGTVTGPGSSGVTVTLEQNPAPYTGGFRSTGLSATTDASGNYAITVVPSMNTSYRVVVKVKRGATSPEAAVRVKVKVTFRMSDRTPKAGQRVWFRGSVLPAHDGKLALIQRRTASGAWHTVATTPLVAAATPVGGASRSTFAKRLAIRRSGTYRVRVAPGDGDHIAGNSASRRAVVH